MTTKCQYLINAKRCNKDAVDEQYCDKHIEAGAIRDAAVFSAITGRYNQDLSEFWMRTNIYLVVQGVLLTAFAQNLDPVVKVVVSIVGITFLFIWYLAARNSIQWIRRWRKRLISIDMKIDKDWQYAKAESVNIPHFEDLLQNIVFRKKAPNRNDGPGWKEIGRRTREIFTHSTTSASLLPLLLFMGWLILIEFKINPLSLSVIYQHILAVGIPLAVATIIILVIINRDSARMEQYDVKDQDIPHVQNGWIVNFVEDSSDVSIPAIVRSVNFISSKDDKEVNLILQDGRLKREVHHNSDRYPSATRYWYLE